MTTVKISQSYISKVLDWLEPKSIGAPSWARLGVDNVMTELNGVIAPVADQLATEIAAGKFRTQNSGKYWERWFASGKLFEEAKSELEKVLTEKTGIGGMSQLAEIKSLVDRYILGCVLHDACLEQERVKEEAHRNKKWAALRPQLFEFAEIASRKSVRFTHRDASPKWQELLMQAYISGHRILDAHFTGSRELSGMPAFKFIGVEMELDPEEQRRFTKLQFVKIGPVTGETYGECLDAEPLLHKVLLACTGGGPKGFNYDNFISTLVRESYPLLSTPTYQLGQKGLGDLEYMDSVVEMCDAVAWLPHRGESTIPEPPEGYASVLPAEWMLNNRVYPQNLNFLGLPVYAHNGVSAIVQLTKEKLPELAKSASDAGVFSMILSSALRDILSDAVSVRLRRLAPSAETVEAALRYIASHQDEVCQSLSDAGAQEKVVKRRVLVPESMNWADHKDWMLLPQHIADMEKDGLSNRTIKMSGVYSVTDEKEKAQIISRFGRSPERGGLEQLGKLMVFPNPLIFHERHSKTELSKPKYVAPDNSCSPPMLVPSQADFTRGNSSFLETQNDRLVQAQRKHSLDALRQHEKNTDLHQFTEAMLRLGFGTAIAAKFAKRVLEASSWRLYSAIHDPSAEIEITEGQKKIYSMYQSYKQLMEDSAMEFIHKVSPDTTEDEFIYLLGGMPKLPNKLFVCSPGVWQPVKSWKKFTPEQKSLFCHLAGVKAEAGSGSPLNQACKYALTPAWLGMVPWEGKSVIVTYDQDADKNINVAQSVSALAQAIMDYAPGTRVYYRMIRQIGSKAAKGADDFIVAHGGAVFWNDLEVFSVRPNIPFDELERNAKKSFIGYILEDRKTFG